MAENGLSMGINPLASLGVGATTPPQMVIVDRAPTTDDVIGYALGTLWWHVITTDPESSICYIFASTYDVVNDVNVQGTGIWVTLNGQNDNPILPNHSVALGTGVPGLSSVGPGNLGTLLMGQGNADPSFELNPSPTIGQPIVSQGAAMEPIYGTCSVSGGGTGLDQVDQYTVLCGGITDEGPLQTVVGTGMATQVLTSNGIGMLPTWQDSGGGTSSAGGPIAVQVFTTPGANTYTPTSGMGSCIVEIVGGGGGGGAAAPGAANVVGAPGGGGGGYSRKLFLAATIGASKTVTIGAAGTGGNSMGPVAPGNGGTTDFGSLFSATGGVGAVNVTLDQGSFDGAVGGTGAGGDFNVPGGAGGASYSIINATDSVDAAVTGYGGSSFFGTGGQAWGSDDHATYENGDGGFGYGSGGGGALVDTGVVETTGGDGQPGICIVTEYGPYGIIPPTSPISISVTVYDTPGAGTFTPNANMFQCQVELLGGGGAGGGVVDIFSQPSGGGGGGGGAYCKKLFDAATIGASKSFVVGSGGIGSLSGTGGNGVATTFGVLLTANGGNGGIFGTGNVGGLGGAGGTSTGGDLNIQGQYGFNGSKGTGATTAFSGNGASTIYGGGGRGAATLSSATTGVGYGSGGGGKFGPSGLLAPDGSSGVIIITEYIQ